MNPALQRLIVLGNRIVAELRRLSDSIEQYAKAEHKRQHSEQEQQRPADVIRIRDAAESIADSQNTAHRPKKWYKDRAFLVSLAGVLIVAAYTTVAAFQWWAIKSQTPSLQRSADAAKSAADTAAKQLELSERPWVDADIKISGPLTYSVNGGSVPILFTLRNSGNSPAFRVWVSPQIVLFGGPDPLVIRNDLCNEAKRTRSGPSIFPNRTFPETWGVEIPQNDIDKAVARFPSFKGDFVGPVLVACIAYSPTFNSASVYSTAYIMKIGKVGTPTLTFKPGETINPGNLGLYFEGFNGIEAH